MEIQKKCNLKILYRVDKAAKDIVCVQTFHFAANTISLTVIQDTLMYTGKRWTDVQAAPLGTFACEKHITYHMAI